MNSIALLNFLHLIKRYLYGHCWREISLKILKLNFTAQFYQINGLAFF